ncbi:GNAT family N-acetyltransferase [Chloroflexota bacterium]
MEIKIRLEEEKDYRRVEEITRSAFSYPGRIERGGIGCPFEHWMVHTLRQIDGIKELSFVAEVKGLVIGHIIYSHARIETIDSRSVPVLNLGPVSVQPEYQQKGAGKALMRATIAKAKELGYGAICFYGRPEYYPQFGFKEAKKFGITDSNGANYPSFMAMELKPGYLKDVHGKYFESTIYDDILNRAAVKEYDKAF